MASPGSKTARRAADAKAVGVLRVVPFPHPQGCRTWLIADPHSGQAMAIDVHLDLVDEVEAAVRDAGWTLPYVVDTHTHADHPSGAGALAPRFSSTRIAHEAARHDGVTRHPKDGEMLHLGDVPVRVQHAPGHTPDHIVLRTDRALFAGDTVLIGAVARTDFLGGDAGQLFDSIHRILTDLPDDTVLYPGHDYEGRTDSTIGHERATNPWLRIQDRAEFAARLTANPPPRPANMDELLRQNREGVAIPAEITAAEAVRRVAAGGAVSVLDVRTGVEFDGEHIAGSTHIPLDRLRERVADARSVPAPRLLLCRGGPRAQLAAKTLGELGLGGLSVVEGGLDAFRQAGGPVVRGTARMSLERQVRIVAGGLIVLGVALGFTVHAAAFALPAFVGCGLVFAGVTDWCGMGLLLAKMPWNRGSTAAQGAAGTCSAKPPAGGCAAQ
jgi:glyoxylase-like metal-dependent hydrolase (beta-lactamase superfamily II)